MEHSPWQKGARLFLTLSCPRFFLEGGDQGEKNIGVPSMTRLPKDIQGEGSGVSIGETTAERASC